jgi:hypothetical protein
MSTDIIEAADCSVAEGGLLAAERKTGQVTVTFRVCHSRTT